MTTERLEQQVEETAQQVEETAQRASASAKEASADERPPWQREEVQAKAKRISPVVAVVLMLALTAIVLMVLRQRRAVSRRDQVIRSLEEVVERASSLAP